MASSAVTVTVASIASPTVCDSPMEECKFHFNEETEDTETAADADAAPAAAAAEDEEPGHAIAAPHSALDGLSIHHVETKEEEEEEDEEEEEKEGAVEEDEEEEESKEGEEHPNEAVAAAAEPAPKTKVKVQLHSQAQRILLDHDDPDFITESLRFHESRAMLLRFNTFCFRITSVEKIVNVELEKKFNEAHEEMEKLGRHSAQPIHPVYHATPSSNLSTIVREGLRIDKRARGIFGAGGYVTPHADYAASYCHADGKLKSGQLHELLRCDVLPGRQAILPHIAVNSARLKHFDSHASPNGFEWVLFDSRVILPRFIITFRAEPAIGVKFIGSVEATKTNANPTKQVCSLANPQFYIHRIALREMRQKKLGMQTSAPFRLNGSEYKIIVLPTYKRSKDGDATGVLIEPMDADCRTTTYAMSIRVLHPLDTSRHTAKQFTREFRPTIVRKSWGAADVLTEQQIEEYTQLDGTVEISIVAYRTTYLNENSPPAPAVAASAAVAIVPRRSEDWFTHRIDIKSWREKKLPRQAAKVFNLNGSEWSLNIEPGSGALPMGAFLYLRGLPAGSNDAIPCMLKMRVVHPQDPLQSISREWNSASMPPPHYGWGASELLPAARVDEFIHADGLLCLTMMAVRIQPAAAAGAVVPIAPVPASSGTVAIVPIVPQPHVTHYWYNNYHVPVKSWREKKLPRQGKIFQLNGNEWNLTIDPGSDGKPVGAFVYLRGLPAGCQEKINCIVKIRVVHPADPMLSISKDWLKTVMSPPHYGTGISDLIPASRIQDLTHPDDCLVFSVMAIRTHDSPPAAVVKDGKKAADKKEDEKKERDKPKEDKKAGCSIM